MNGKRELMPLIRVTVWKVFATCLYALFIIHVGCNTDRDAQTSDITAGQQENESVIFEKIPGSYSYLNFENNIQEDLNSLENLFNFDYFYNGAGVGVEDLNNDGLLDVIFCGNQVENRIFINEGDFQFNDITSGSGLEQGKKWTNGIAFADINEDGWMDIYFSQGGPYSRLDRKNLLFVNQKDGTYSEEAEAYGLADMGISTQSAFFDMDNDGDLDCIVMNENEFYGVDPIQLYELIGNDPERMHFNSSHLYRNDGGTFTDITREAGLEQPIFGLGLMVSDFNTDGLADIYIASDYYIPDALFINNGDGTFTDQVKQYTQQISFFGMGMDVADINNDLLQDIFVLDMASSDHIRSKTLMASMNTNRFNYLVYTAGFHHQYMFNSLQLNQGNNQFSNIAQLTNMANTDWSWSVLMNDFDLNGTKDVYVTNGYRRYALDNDLQIRVYEAQQKYRNQVPLEVKTQLYNSMPSEKLANILYKNHGDLQFTNTAQSWGLGDPSFSNGAAIGDLDNDGDLDLVVSNMDENAFLYKNLSREKDLGNYLTVKVKEDHSEPMTRVTAIAGDLSQLVETKRIRGYMSSHENTAHFGLAKKKKVDTLHIKWADGQETVLTDVAVNQTLVIAKEDGLTQNNTVIAQETLTSQIDPGSLGLSFIHKENPFDDFEREVLLPYKQSNQGPCIAQGDINGDGKIDLFLGGASGQAAQMWIQSDGGFRVMAPEIFKVDAGYEDTGAVFFDLDGDNDLDLYVVSGGNEFDIQSSYYADRLYINDGKGNFSRKIAPALQQNRKSGKAVAALDFDKDGDIDLLVGNRMIPKNYPKHDNSVLYENVNGTLQDKTSEIAPEFQDFGIINDILITDINQDGWEDFVAVGEWSSPAVFKNKQGIFERDQNIEAFKVSGWWFSAIETDVNKDGLPDYVLGNAGLNLKFKASAKKPFKVYATDFDDNGINDIVLSKEYKGEYVPVRGRECSSQQMPFIKSKFPSYKEFAQASLEDVYGDKLNESYEKEVTEFQSILMINKGNMEFQKVILPVEAQMIPVLTMVTTDLNGDGYKDLILAGNIYETEVETPRLDALSGVVLLADRKGGYNALSHSISGLYLNGNVKSIALVPFKDKQLLVAAQNNESIKTYNIN